MTGTKRLAIKLYDSSMKLSVPKSNSLRVSVSAQCVPHVSDICGLRREDGWPEPGTE